MGVSLPCGLLGMRALDAELCTLFCSAFDILLLTKVIIVVLSFVTLRQRFTFGSMSCGTLPSDGPFNWADREECTRLNRFFATFLG